MGDGACFWKEALDGAPRLGEHMEPAVLSEEEGKNRAELPRDQPALPWIPITAQSGAYPRVLQGGPRHERASLQFSGTQVEDTVAVSALEIKILTDSTA